MNMLEIVLGQIPEAVYFALFMILTKKLKSKRILYIVLMIIEYLLLKSFIKYNVWFQIAYTIIQFIILKVLYKEKAQITDIFTFTIASIILIVSCVTLYFIVWATINNYIVYVILNRIVLLLFLLLFRNKLSKIQNMYKRLWNRNDKVKTRMKSTTFRAFNIVIFNVMFYIINLGMIFMIIQNGGV